MTYETQKRFAKFLSYLKENNTSIAVIEYESEGRLITTSSCNGVDDSRDVEFIISHVGECFFADKPETEIGKGTIILNTIENTLTLKHTKAIFIEDSELSKCIEYE